MTEKVYLGFGSNLGDREKNIFLAIDAMQKIEGFKVTRIASLYETPPLYNLDQPDFLNTAVEGISALKPQQLLKEINQVERNLGRTEVRIKNDPRFIDIDILSFEHSTVANSSLKVPHEGLSSRLFALTPLAEIASDFIIPKLGLTPVELIARCPDTSEIRQFHLGKIA